MLGPEKARWGANCAISLLSDKTPVSVNVVEGYMPLIILITENVGTLESSMCSIRRTSFICSSEFKSWLFDGQ